MRYEGEVAVAVSINVVQEHSLGRMEAKRRLDEKISAMIINHSDWGISGSWTDNVYSFKLSSGVPAGSSGTITVRNNSVDLALSVPDAYAGYTDIIKSKAQQELANTLG